VFGAVITIRVESKTLVFNSLTKAAIEASTNLNSLRSAALGVPAASKYPPVTPLLCSMSFCPTLTALEVHAEDGGNLGVSGAEMVLAIDFVQEASTFKVS
jgi:hypothetical protein